MEDKTLPVFKPCTDKAYAESFLQFAMDAKKHIKTQDDSIWLDKEIAHIKFVLNHRNGEMCHTLSRHIPTISEQVLTSVMRRTNDKLRSADQLGYANMVGSDIVPLEGAEGAELTAAEVKVISFGQDRNPTKHGAAYSAQVSNLQRKFTTVIVLMLDPNFSGKPYRLNVVGVDEYAGDVLDYRFGDVDTSRQVTFHNPSNTRFPGTPIIISDLGNDQAEIQSKFHEFNLNKMATMLYQGNVAKNQLQYWNDVFQKVVARSKGGTSNPLPKQYSTTPTTAGWTKVRASSRTLVATKNGYRQA